MESNTYEILIKEMKTHAESESPKECCGVITSDFKYIPYDNISPKPEEFFVLDPMALVDYPDCWGIFHSHPEQDNPLPSEGDADSASFKEYTFLVGWKDKFYVYWYDNNISSLRFKKFTKDYLCNSS